MSPKEKPPPKRGLRKIPFHTEVALRWLLKSTSMTYEDKNRPTSKKAGMGLIGGCGALAAFIATSPDDDDMDDFSNDSGLGRSSVSDIVHNRINQSTDDEF